MICVTSDDNSNNLVVCKNGPQTTADSNVSRCRFQMDNDNVDQWCGPKNSQQNTRSCVVDGGYSSGHDSAPGSQGSSDVACSEGFCNHNGKLQP